jgi:hypothetical protein
MKTLIHNHFNTTLLNTLVSIERIGGALHCKFNALTTEQDGIYPQKSIALTCPAFFKAWLQTERIPDNTLGAHQYRVDMAKSLMQESPRRWLLLEDQRLIAGCELVGLDFTTAHQHVPGWSPTVSLKLNMLKVGGVIGPCSQPTSWSVLEANFPGCIELVKMMSDMKRSPTDSI